MSAASVGLASFPSTEENDTLIASPALLARDRLEDRDAVAHGAG